MINNVIFIRPDYTYLVKYFPDFFLKKHNVVLEEDFKAISSLCEEYNIQEHIANFSYLLYRSQLEFEQASKDKQFYREVYELHKALDIIINKYGSSILIQKIIDDFNDPLLITAGKLIKDKKDVPYKDLELLSPYIFPLIPDEIKKGKDGRPSTKTDADSFKMWLTKRIHFYLVNVQKSSNNDLLESDIQKFNFIISFMVHSKIFENNDNPKHKKNIENWINQS